MVSPTGTTIDWAAVYGNNNAAAQMLSDLPWTTYENLQVSGLTDQLTTLEQQVSQIQNQMSAWTTLQNDAGAVQSSLQALTQPATFQGMQAVSSNPAILTAAADASAVAGSYAVTVQQVAAQEIDGTASTAIAITSATAALNLATTSIDLTVGGVTYSVAITPSLSLSSIAAEINASGAPVTAMVETDSATGTDYLMIFGSQTGQAISYGGSTAVWQDIGILSSSGTVNTVQAAADAEISLGTGTVYTSPNNTFASVLPGITLQVASTGTAMVTVNPDPTAAVQAVQTFVANWNQWVSDTQKLAMGTLASVSANGTFSSNPNQVIQSALPMMNLNLIAQTLINTEDQGNSLATLGIMVTGQDQFTVNTAQLTQALNQNATTVQQFFTALASVVTPLLTQFAQGSQSVTGTAISLDQNEVAQLNQRINTVENEITQEQTTAQATYAAWTAQLQQWAQTDSMLSALTAQNSNSNG